MARARAGWLVGRGLWLVGGGEQFESSSQQCSWLLNELGDLSGSLIYCTAVSLEHILGGGWVNGPLKHAPGGVKTRKDPKLLKDKAPLHSRSSRQQAQQQTCMALRRSGYSSVVRQFLQCGTVLYCTAQPDCKQWTSPQNVVVVIDVLHAESTHSRLRSKRRTGLTKPIQSEPPWPRNAQRSHRHRCRSE